MPLHGKGGTQVSRSARRHKKAEAGHGDEERWLITYADMITLLMAFFIMMYAMSIPSLGKFTALAVSVKTGFGGDSAEMLSNMLQFKTPEKGRPLKLPLDSFTLMNRIAQSIRQSLPPELAENLDFLSEDGVVKIRARSDDILFARGSATLTAKARRTLAVVARELADMPYDIRVEGHTCDLPVRGGRFPSNWELSSQRAINVVLLFVRAQGISPLRVSAAGFADTVPAVPNTSEANRAQNRRIDIVLVRPTKATTKLTRSTRGVRPTKPDLAPRQVDIAPPARAM